MEDLKHWVELVENSCRQEMNITIIANDKRKLSEANDGNSYETNIEDIKRELNYFKVNMKYEFNINDVHYFKGLSEDQNEFKRFEVRLYTYTYCDYRTCSQPFSTA